MIEAETVVAGVETAAAGVSVNLVEARPVDLVAEVLVAALPVDLAVAGLAAAGLAADLLADSVEALAEDLPVEAVGP